MINWLQYYSKIDTVLKQTSFHSIYKITLIPAYIPTHCNAEADYP